MPQQRFVECFFDCDDDALHDRIEGARQVEVRGPPTVDTGNDSAPRRLLAEGLDALSKEISPDSMSFNRKCAQFSGE